MTWPVVALVIGVLAIAAARDVLVRLQKAHDQDATDKKIESLEAQLKATTEDISHLNNIVRDQTTRLTLSRKRSG